MESAQRLSSPVLDDQNTDNTHQPPPMFSYMQEDIHGFDFSQAIYLLELVAREKAHASHLAVSRPNDANLSPNNAKRQSTFHTHATNIIDLASHEEKEPRHALRRFGENDHPFDDPALCQAYINLHVNSSEIKALIPSDVPHIPPVLLLNFLGIAGIQGPLPDVFTEILMAHEKSRDHGMSAFLDIFHHRLAMFWHKISTKVFPHLTHEGPITTPHGQCLLDVAGAAHHNASHAMLSMPGVFWQKSRSLLGLERIIAEYFDVPCRIQPFIGGWNKGALNQRTLLGKVYHRLGESAILGNATYDQRKGFIIILGPLEYETFRKFLPTPQDAQSSPMTPDHKVYDLHKKENGIKALDESMRDANLYNYLRQCVKAYFCEAHDFFVQLRLKRGEAPFLCLNGKQALGYNTWLLSPQRPKTSRAPRTVVTIHHPPFHASSEK